LRQPLTERYREPLAGVLSCYRIIVTGTLPGPVNAKGMTGFLLPRPTLRRVLCN
jgi:hypothetical protein